MWIRYTLSAPLGPPRCQLPVATPTQPLALAGVLHACVYIPYDMGEVLGEVGGGGEGSERQGWRSNQLSQLGINSCCNPSRIVGRATTKGGR